MRSLRKSMLGFVFLVLAGGFLAVSQPRTLADPSTLQAIYLACPLRSSYKINALYDYTGTGQAADNQIQIYTQATVRDDPGTGDECNDGGWWGYTDWDSNLWNLRWDQDNDPAGCPIGGPGWLWYDGHEAYDLSCPERTPVNAARQGTAYHVGTTDLRIEHGSGYVTYYRHLRAGTRIPPGAVVTGQRIAETGVGGTGPHLHFEVQLNGSYVDPYGWEQGNLWAGGEPFPLGYLDQDNSPHGPFPLDNTKIRDFWFANARRLGSPTGDDYTGGCKDGGIESTYYVQGFERGYISYCGSGAAQATYYGVGGVGSLTFLPRVLASEDANAWNSTIYIRNLHSSGSAVSVTFYTPDGRILDSRVYNGLLPANATWEVNVRNALYGEFLSRTDYNPIFAGAAIVASDQDVAVTVRTEGSNEVTAYTGISSRSSGSGWGEPATTFYIPTVMWRAWSTEWRSYISVQNTTADPSNVTVTYCYQDSPTTCFNDTRSGTLAPYGNATYDLQDELGDTSFWGFARVVSTNGRALAVAVNQDEPTYGSSDYNAFSSGSTVVRLPSVMRSWWNWNSSFTVQNLGGTATDVLIDYVEDDGSHNSFRRYYGLAAGASVVITQYDASYGVSHENWHGTAKLSSNSSQPLAAIVNQELLDWPVSGQHSHISYSGSVARGIHLYAPFAANRGASADYYFDTSSDVQNLGSTACNISTQDGYYYPGGSGIVPSGSTTWTLAWAVSLFYLPIEPGVPTGFTGSLKVNPAANTITGLHNLARSVNAAGAPTPSPHDFSAGYNMPQR